MPFAITEELSFHQNVDECSVKRSGASIMAGKTTGQPGEAAHLYRYRTPVLVGPWRKTARQALLDALRARQARRDERDRQVVHWLVPGGIEERATP